MSPPNDPWEIIDDEPYIPKRERAKVIFRPDLPPVRVKWTVEIQGSMIHVVRHILDPLPAVHHPKKKSHLFTRESQMNLLREVNRIDWHQVGRSSFLTLTYPPDYVSWSHEKRTQDRYQIMRTFESLAGRQLASIWKVEWKRRRKGADVGQWVPHIHIMILNCPWVNHRSVRKRWRKIIGYHDGPLSTWLKEITTHAGCAKYLAKYITKYCSLDISGQLNNSATLGRAWGMGRPELIPWSPVLLDRELSAEEAAKLRQLFSERQAWYDLNIHGGFTWYGEEDAKLISEILVSNLELRGYGC